MSQVTYYIYLIDVQLSIYDYSNLELDQAHEIFEKRNKESELEKEYKLIGLSALAKIKKKDCPLSFRYSLFKYYV